MGSAVLERDEGSQYSFDARTLLVRWWGSAVPQLWWSAYYFTFEQPPFISGTAERRKVSFIKSGSAVRYKSIESLHMYYTVMWLILQY